MRKLPPRSTAFRQHIFPVLQGTGNCGIDPFATIDGRWLKRLHFASQSRAGWIINESVEDANLVKLPKHFSVVRGLISIVAVLAAGKIIAADSLAANTSSAPLNDSIDEIIVTAQRREEKLDRVPISVTAFLKKTMDRQRHGVHKRR